jgi:uncharacterized protein YkwD
VACGKDLATSISLVAPPWPSDVAQQERMVLENINAERTEAGLPALPWDDAVAAVARSLSQDLSDEARRAAAAASIVERLQRAGVASPVVFVNPAQGRSAEEASQRLLASPTHRANLMNPEVNQAGVGVTVVQEKEGTFAYLAEIFVKALPPMDVKEVRGQLVAAIAQRRQEAKAAPVPVSPSLQGVAQKYAEEMAAAKGTLPEERDTQLLDSLRKGYKGVSMLAGASANPVDFAKDKKVLASGKDLGVGLAQGEHPKLGRNAAYIVVLVGEPREAKEKPAKPKAGK